MKSLLPLVVLFAVSPAYATIIPVGTDSTSTVYAQGFENPNALVGDTGVVTLTTPGGQTTFSYQERAWLNDTNNTFGANKLTFDISLSVQSGTLTGFYFPISGVYATDVGVVGQDNPGTWNAARFPDISDGLLFHFSTDALVTSDSATVVIHTDGEHLAPAGIEFIGLGGGITGAGFQPSPVVPPDGSSGFSPSPEPSTLLLMSLLTVGGFVLVCSHNKHASIASSCS